MEDPTRLAQVRAWYENSQAIVYLRPMEAPQGRFLVTTSRHPSSSGAPSRLLLTPLYTIMVVQLLTINEINTGGITFTCTHIYSILCTLYIQLQNHSLKQAFMLLFSSFQTWNLSKILHSRIFRKKILHRQFHLILTVLVRKNTKNE